MKSLVILNLCHEKFNYCVVCCDMYQAFVIISMWRSHQHHSCSYFQNNKKLKGYNFALMSFWYTTQRDTLQKLNSK